MRIIKNGQRLYSQSFRIEWIEFLVSLATSSAIEERSLTRTTRVTLVQEGDSLLFWSCFCVEQEADVTWEIHSNVSHHFITGFLHESKISIFDFGEYIIAMWGFYEKWILQNCSFYLFIYVVCKWLLIDSFG